MIDKGVLTILEVSRWFFCYPALACRPFDTLSMISLKGGIMGVVCTNKAVVTADTGNWINFVIRLTEKRAQQKVAF